MGTKEEKQKIFNEKMKDITALNDNLNLAYNSWRCLLVLEQINLSLGKINNTLQLIEKSIK